MALAALLILLFGRIPIWFFGLFDTLANFRWQAVFLLRLPGGLSNVPGTAFWAYWILAFSAIAALPLVSLYFPASQPRRKCPVANVDTECAGVQSGLFQSR